MHGEYIDDVNDNCTQSQGSKPISGLYSPLFKPELGHVTYFGKSNAPVSYGKYSIKPSFQV